MVSKRKSPKGRVAQLRTSREVYDRLRWDPAFDLSPFIVGYEERFSGMREAPLAKFAGEGEIPWHRVWYIRVGDLQVWDRKARVDLLFGSGSTQTTQHEDIQRAIAGQTAPPLSTKPKKPVSKRSKGQLPRGAQASYHYDQTRDEWLISAAIGQSAPPKDSLTLVTYNLLFDLYEPEKLATEVRVPALIALLVEADADLVALVEVTPSLLTTLLEHPWIRNHYFVSERPDGPSIAPYGQVLLARAPMHIHFYQLAGHKRIVAGFVTLAGIELCCLAIHLTSNRAEGARQIRADEFAQLRTWVDSLDPVDATIVLGDFNVYQNELDGAIADAGFVDLWPAVYPDEPGYTFHPQHNALAAFSSRTQTPRRLDRCLIRARENLLTPVDVALLGTAPLPQTVDGAITPLFASDHYGLWCLLQVQQAPEGTEIDLATLEPTHHCAVVLLPHRDLWPAIEAVRQEHDRHHDRWMPHITLLYPFVPHQHLPAAVARLDQVAATVEPFALAFDDVGHFTHGHSRTGFLAPTSTPTSALIDLQQALVAAFPRCHPTPDGGQFVPHLTLGQLSRGDDFRRQLNDWRDRACSGAAHNVGEIVVIGRDADRPFRLLKRIALGSRPQVLDRGQLLADLEAICTDIILGGIRPDHVRLVHPIGSERLGVSTPDSDLDAVVIGPAWQTPEQLFAHLPTALAQHGYKVLLAHQPGRESMRLQLNDQAGATLDLDLQYVRWPSGVPLCPPANLTQAQRSTLNKAEVLSLTAILDADTIISRAANHISPAVFLATLRWLRVFARARGIYGNARTYPGGISWALLLLSTIPQGEEIDATESVEGCLARCLQTLHAGKLAAVGEPGPGPSPAKLHVWTPTKPAVNSTRNSTASTASRLREELARGAKLAKDRSDHWLQDLCVATDLRTVYPQLLAVQLREQDARGTLDQRFVGLVLELEASLGTTIAIDSQPHKNSRGDLIWVIGLPALNREQLAAVHTAAQAWSDGCGTAIEVVGPAPPQAFSELSRVTICLP